MGEIKLVGSLVLLSLYSICVIMYAVGFAIDNGTAINLANDPSFSNYQVNAQSNLSEFNIETNSSSFAFAQSTISGGDQTTVTGGQFKIGLGSLLMSVKMISSVINEKIFGGDVAFGIFMTALVGFLIYAGFRYQWKTWKEGNPD